MTTQTKVVDSKKWDILLIGSILAFMALLTAIMVFIVAALAPDLVALPYLMLIKDLALIGVVAVPAYAFVSNKRRVWRIVYWVCIAIVVVAAIFGNMHII